MTNLPFFKPGTVQRLLHLLPRQPPNWTFTYLVDNVPHQSSHRFENAAEAKAAMRRLVAAYNELYREMG